MGDDEGGYRFTRDLSGESLWTLVEGGDLPMPVEIVFHRSPDGRYVVSRLSIGQGWLDKDGNLLDEVTSATLRQIRLSEIQAAYFDYFDPVRLIEESIPMEVLSPIQPPGRGPDEQALRAFARTYMTELARQPHRAMTAAAKAHNISRATANRWAALCREYGYLPSGDEGKSAS